MMHDSSGAEEPGHAAAPGFSGAVRFPDDVDQALPAAHQADLRLAAEAAVRGGMATLVFYRSDSLKTEEKSPGDPVTEADHASNDAVLAVICSRCPADAVLSEESAPPSRAGAGGRLWVVDPLDGTREFIDGIDEFACMVGLAHRGRAVLGAVYVPGSRRLYLGVADGGAWVAECNAAAEAGFAVSIGPLRSLHVSRPADGRTRLVRSRSHPDERLARIEAALPSVDIVPSGSVGVKCARIATGEADLYVHPVPYLKEWDTCAPEAMLRGAGGEVTDCGGQPLAYGKADPKQPGGILAGHPSSWAGALPLVRRESAGIL